MGELIEMDSDLLITMEHPKGGTLRAIRCPVTMSETPATLRYVPPQVGEHTVELFTEVLGEARTQALKDAGVIG